MQEKVLKRTESVGIGGKITENVGAAVEDLDGNQKLIKNMCWKNFEADYMPELYVGELPKKFGRTGSGCIKPVYRQIFRLSSNCEMRDFQSGARSNWHIDVKKVMYLRLPEQTERQRPLHCLERS